MTDNEIIKAFEYRLKVDGGTRIDRELLDLINRQKAEIERLTDTLNAAIAGQETLQKHIATQQAEIERLKKAIKVLEMMTDQHAYDREKAKSEAIKEFAERLEPLKKFRSCMTTSEYELSVTMREVDAVKKELMKETGR